MTKILQINTYDWQEEAKGNTPNTSEGTVLMLAEDALATAEDCSKAFEEAAAKTPNAYSYYTYEVGALLSGLKQKFEKSGSYECLGYLNPLSDAEKTNISGITFICRENEEVISAAAYERFTRQQLQLAVLDGQKKIMLSILDSLKEDDTQYMFSPAGSLLYSPVTQKDRVIKDGQTIIAPRV